MEQHSVRPREGSNRLNLIRSVNRSELRRLCNADGAHHVPMQLDLFRDELFCLAQVDLSAIRSREKQFSSPRVKLRSATFVSLNVRALVADHSVEGLAKLGQTERIRPGTGEHKINIAIDFENVPNAFTHLRSPFVLPIRGRIMSIRLFQCCPCLGTNRCSVITGKLVTNRVHAHRASITRVLPPDNEHQEIA